jgi:hypothetical protein
MNFQGQTVYKIDQRMESDIKDAVAKNAQQVAPCARKKKWHIKKLHIFLSNIN